MLHGVSKPAPTTSPPKSGAADGAAGPRLNAATKTGQSRWPRPVRARRLRAGLCAGRSSTSPPSTVVAACEPAPGGFPAKTYQPRINRYHQRPIPQRFSNLRIETPVRSRGRRVKYLALFRAGVAIGCSVRASIQTTTAGRWSAAC